MKKQVQSSTGRVASIDVFRALTMFLMIWVNDFWTLNDIPKWLEHAAAGEDYLGFSDLIFPWFIFIVGLSVPFAFEHRLKKDRSLANSWLHIFFRTLALVVMGLFHVNLETYHHDATLLPKSVYTIIATIAFFMIWNRYPRATGRRQYLFPGLRIAGIGILIGLFILYRGQAIDGSVRGFGTHWWGILGLIGWVYFITASVYIVFRGSALAIIIALLASLALNIISSNGISYNIFSWQSGSWVPGNGGLQALAFGGILASVLLRKYNKTQSGRWYAIIVTSGILALCAGMLQHGQFIISKISGTPPWILLSLSSAFLIFAGLHWVVDVKGLTRWYQPFKTAGTATLTCYLVPYIYYSIRDMLGIELPDFLTTGWIGLIKSFTYAFLVIGITWSLTRLHIKLKI